MSQSSTLKLVPKTLFIVGPTASGKSALALELASRIDGEIICADSQTIRRHLDIGTAKPSAKERALVPHHMLDLIDPYESFSVADFTRLAREKIGAVHARGNVPIVVGGSGLYVDALFFNYHFNVTKTNEDFSSYSVSELQAEIKKRKLTMPKNDTNPRHLIGVLRRGPEHEYDRSSPLRGTTIVGLSWPDPLLKERIDHRIEIMFNEGFIDETQQLLARFGEPPRTLDAIGYPLMLRYLKGEIDIEEAKELFKRSHWQYVRKQKAWFRRNLFIHWLEPSEQTVQNLVRLMEQG